MGLQAGALSDDHPVLGTTGAAGGGDTGGDELGVLLICGPVSWEYFRVISAVRRAASLSYPPPWTHSRSRSFSHSLIRSLTTRIFSRSDLAP